MNTLEQIYEVINGVDEIKGISLDKNDLLSDNINSLSFIVLLMRIEEKFEIEINEDDLNYDTFKTLEDIEKYIKNRKTLILNG